MKAEKIKYKNNWFYVDSEDLEEPTITKLFLYKDEDLTIPVKTSRGTLMVRKSDLEDQLKEWGGAGFSMGSSIFPVNRGGQMNRGGFGGSNNLGGPNMMYTYEIKPLTRNLQPKPTDFEPEAQIQIGNYIEGIELNKKDDEIHRGTVLGIEKTEDNDIMYYVILCDETSTKMKIDPTTAILLSGDTYVDPENGVQNRSKDQADLVRAGKMQENKNNVIRAKTVKETLNE